MPKTGDRFNPYKLFIGSFIPNCLMAYPEISSSAKLLWARLAQYAGSKGDCFPTQEELSNQLGISKRTVINLVNELVEKRLIEVERMGMDEKLKKQANRYYFKWHEIFEGNEKGVFIEIKGDQNRNGEKVSPLGSTNGEELFTYKGEEPFTYPGEGNFTLRESNNKRESLKEEEGGTGSLFPPSIFFQCDFFKIDQTYYKELKEEFPIIDFVKLFKKLKDKIIDEPKRYKRDGRGRLIALRQTVRTWCEREIIWGEKNAKSKEGDDPIDRRARLIFGEDKKHEGGTVEENPGSTGSL